jgi:hypothetical protein
MYDFYHMILHMVGSEFIKSSTNLDFYIMHVVSDWKIEEYFYGDSEGDGIGGENCNFTIKE